MKEGRNPTGSKMMKVSKKVVDPGKSFPGKANTVHKAWSGKMPETPKKGKCC